MNLGKYRILEKLEWKVYVNAAMSHDNVGND